MVKNIFITGGKGQDSRIIVNLLKNKNLKINLFYRGSKIESTKHLNCVKINLLNKKKIIDCFIRIKPDIVLHLAANNPSFNESGYNKFYKQNVISTKNLFYSTFKVNKNAKFIFCNSSQIFKKKNGTVSEQSEISPSSDYTRFRIDCDKLMQNYKKRQNILYTNVILFNHDSVFRNKKFLLPRIIKSIINKDVFFLKKIISENIHGDFSHADDICKGLIKIIINRDNIDKIILSSGKSTSINKIIFHILKKYKINLDIKVNKVKLKKTLIGNNKKAKEKLSWTPKKNILIAANQIYRSLISK